MIQLMLKKVKQLNQETFAASPSQSMFYIHAIITLIGTLEVPLGCTSSLVIAATAGKKIKDQIRGTTKVVEISKE